MVWFTDYNIFISVKAYVIASQERRMYKLFKKMIKGQKNSKLHYILSPNVCTLKKMKASLKKLAENANQLMKADKRSFHKLN